MFFMKKIEVGLSPKLQLRLSSNEGACQMQGPNFNNNWLKARLQRGGGGIQRSLASTDILY